MRVILPKGLPREEQAVAVLPPLAGRGGESWNRRLNLYAGRDLTANALAIEQRHRERHLARLGRALSPGIVAGLDVTVDPGPEGRPDRLAVAPGRGLLADGQDVVLTEARSLPTDELVTLDNSTPLPEQPGDVLAPPPQGVGVLLLVPVLVTQDAAALDEANDAFADPCPDDLSRIAFTDFRHYDGALIAFHPWPATFALPPTSERARNLLAYEIFAREAGAEDERAPLPWNRFGVALALVQLDPVGKVVLLDRGAVARRGGVSLVRRATRGMAGLPADRGTPFLWQARLQQLAAQTADELAGGWDGGDASSRFRFLPPVGVVPRSVWDADFFPESWHRLAAPVPLQQLELAITASAGLEPFDLDAALVDVVRWLIPVPEEVYEPGLLEVAVVNPAFDATVASLLFATSGARARRDRLRDSVRRAVEYLDRQGVAAFPDDVDAVADEEPAAAPDPPLEPAAAFAETRVATPLAELHAALAASGRFTPDELRRIDPAAVASALYQGLGAFATELQARLDEGDDRIDLGFTRLQAELYRVRQIVLDNEEATKLATSPVLAGIVREGVSAVTTSDAIKTFFATRRGVRVDATSAATAALQPLTPAVALAAQPALAALRPGGIVREVRAELAKEAGLRDPRREREIIRLKLPIPGQITDFRTVTIADRLKISAALEAKSAAVRLKSELLISMLELGVPLDALPVPLTPPGIAVLPGPLFEKLLLAPFNVDQRQIIDQILAPRRTALRGDSPAEPDSLFLINVLPLTQAEIGILAPQRGLAALFEKSLAEAAAAGRRTGLSDPELVNAAIAGRLDPDPPNGDEAAFLSAAIGILEGTVAILRAVEGRIVELRALLDRCRATLAETEIVLGEWRALLADAARLLAERRHDLTVARALREEERTRIQAINRRRQEVLDKEVPFVAFARARLASPSAGRALPRRPLAGRLVDPVEPCLDEHLEPPAELGAMLGVLRDVPLGWLRAADALLDRLDRPEQLERLYTTAIDRARLLSLSAVPGSPTVGTVPAAALATSAQKLAVAWGGLGRRFVAARAELDAHVIVGRSWREIKERALRELSLDDLIESGRNQPALVKLASAELERIERVATCLHDRLRQLPVEVRLAWVQELSLFDAARDLERLEQLPRFADVPSAMRRELVRFVMWLFERLIAGEAEARALMSDIVRVAILLAGHAPVASLVQATLARDFTGGVGDVLTLEIPTAKARIGMLVELSTATGQPVSGVVADLLGRSASVRITRTPAPLVSIAATSQIRLFQLPGRDRPRS
ncbi:MAG: hypothetical protein ACREIR_09845 [Geminicoccaceae bacterium]